MIKEIEFFIWRVRLGIEFERVVTDGTFWDGFKYSKCLKDLWEEDFGPEDALHEDMSYWDG